VDLDFTFDAGPFVASVARLTLRAKIALGIGIYEWIVFRFHRVSNDPVPLQTAEAAWCANARQDCMEYFELDRMDWTGAVRGPLWCANAWLQTMIFFNDESLPDWETGLYMLMQLAMHVLPDTTVFRDWLTTCTSRLRSLYTAQPDDPFDDLFGDREEERRGPLVPREALHMTKPYRPDEATELTRRYLLNTAQSGNPFVHIPRVLADPSAP
jgi:hypothetical protein